MGSRIRSIIKKEFIQIRRDRRTIGMMIGMPVMLLVILGYAATFDVKHASFAAWDQTKSEQSRKLIDTLRDKDQQIFDGTYTEVNSREAMKDALKDGKARAGIIIPANFLAPGGGPETREVEVFADGANLIAAQSAVRKALELINKYNMGNISAPPSGSATSGQPSGGGQAPSQVIAKQTVLFNEQMKSSWAMVPGLVGVILQMITTMLTSMAIVRERERGTLEQLMVTPVKPIELMIGKIVPYIAVAFFELIIVFVAGFLIFRVDFAGNILLLFLLSVLFLMSSLGIALLISTVSDNQQQAMQLAVFTIVPSILISGFVFPTDAMPIPIRAVSYFLPLTYFIEILRGIWLKGIGLLILWPQVLALFGYAVIVLALSALRFKKRVS